MEAGTEKKATASFLLLLLPEGKARASRMPSLLFHGNCPTQEASPCLLLFLIEMPGTGVVCAK